MDTNVTRHLDQFLSPARNEEGQPPSDWDVLILHYLGLDHVGHLGGARSPLMPAKQVEMDRVIERIFQSLKQRDQLEGKESLIVVVGDHGMTEMGNHGGSSIAETRAALFITSPTRKTNSNAAGRQRMIPSVYLPARQVVNQIDLVPTLSALFDLGIPTNSMGRLIRTVLSEYGPEYPLAILLRDNARQLERVLEGALPGASGQIARNIAQSGPLSSDHDIESVSPMHIPCGKTFQSTESMSASSSYQKLKTDSWRPLPRAIFDR